MNLQTSAQTLLARSMNLQANFILRQVPEGGKPTVTTGAAQQPRVRTPSGTAAVGIPAATGGDAKLRQSVATLRRDVEVFREELQKAVQDGSLPSKQVDELVLKWSELDAQVDALLKLDTRRFDDKRYVLRAQDVGSFLNTTEAGIKGEVSAKDVKYMPVRKDRTSLKDLSLPERLEGLSVEAARKLVNDVYAARIARPAGASAPQGTKVLTEATFTNFFAKSEAGHAVKNDSTFEPKLLQHLQANTGQSDKTSIQDILAGKTEAEATRLLAEALELTTVAAVQDNAAAEALKVNKMVAALGVTPMQVPEDGHCLYHALAKSADPSKPVNGATAAAMRTEMLAGVRGSVAQMGRITPQNVELMVGLKSAAQVIDRIEAGLKPGAENSSAWGGPEEMQLYAMQKNRTVVFISTNGGYLHTPDQSTPPITDPTEFKEALDKQAAADKAAGRKPPLIVINKTDTHFEAAVYPDQASVASPVPKSLGKQLLLLEASSKYNNTVDEVLARNPEYQVNTARIALADLRTANSDAQVQKNQTAKELGVAKAALLKAQTAGKPTDDLERQVSLLTNTLASKELMLGTASVKEKAASEAYESAMAKLKQSRLELVDLDKNQAEEIASAQGSLAKEHQAAISVLGNALLGVRTAWESMDGSLKARPDGDTKASLVKVAHSLDALRVPNLMRHYSVYLQTDVEAIGKLYTQGKQGFAAKESERLIARMTTDHIKLGNAIVELERFLAQDKERVLSHDLTDKTRVQAESLLKALRTLHQVINTPDGVVNTTRQALEELVNNVRQAPHDA